MLKWFFGALVLANIGLVMWASWYKLDPASQHERARTPIAPEKMHLVGDPAARLEARAPDKEPAKALTVVKRACFTVGPFSAPDRATRAGARLKQKGFAWRTRTEEKSRRIYQVYVGPLGNAQAARIMQRRLRRLGFKDTAVIIDGTLKNAVSAGIFAKAKNARDVRRRLKAKKIRGRTSSRTMRITRYWLDVRAEAGSGVALAAMKWRDRSIKLTQGACANAPAAHQKKAAKR